MVRGGKSARGGKGKHAAILRTRRVEDIPPRRTRVQEREESESEGDEEIQMSPPREEPEDDVSENESPREEPEDDVSENESEEEEEVQPEPVQEPPTEAVSIDILRAIETAITHIAQGSGGRRENRAVEAQRQFRMMEPPIFKADGEANEAEEWLICIEQIFKTLQLEEDNLRLQTATYYLRGEAGAWWKGFATLHEGEDITWEDFSEAFLAEFFSDTVREERRDEFLHLSQQGLTVTQYHRKFITLSRYAVDIVSTENRKIRKFEQGLRSNISIPVMAGLHKTFKDCVTSALRTEAGIQKRQQEERTRTQNKKKPSGNPSKSVGFPTTEHREVAPERQQGSQQNRKRLRDSASPFQQPALPATSTAPRANTSTPTCYNCGQPGHFARVCPMPLRCRLCGSEGHIPSNCPQAICRVCGKQGHMRSTCPQNFSNAQPIQSVGPTVPSAASFQGPGPNQSRNQGTGGSRGGGQGGNRGGHRQNSHAQNFALPQLMDQPEPANAHSTFPSESTQAS